MPLAMRNLAIAQERDKNRFRHVRGGGYDKPKAKFAKGQYVLLKQAKSHTLQPSVTPHILKITELRKSGVVVLQGRDGHKVSRQISQLAHCSVPVADHKIYPEKYISTDKVHCQICSERGDDAFMLLCDACNRGFHTFCLDEPVDQVPTGDWYCPDHQVKT